MLKWNNYSWHCRLLNLKCWLAITHYLIVLSFEFCNFFLLIIQLLIYFQRVGKIFLDYSISRNFLVSKLYYYLNSCGDVFFFSFLVCKLQFSAHRRCFNILVKKLIGGCFALFNVSCSWLLKLVVFQCARNSMSNLQSWMRHFDV